MLVASFDQANGVAVDTATHDVYVAEEQGNAVKKVAPDGTVTTVATIAYPLAVAFDRNSKALFVTDDGLDCNIWKVLKGGHLIPVEPAHQFCDGYGLTVDSQTHALYVSDRAHGTIVNLLLGKTTQIADFGLSSTTTSLAFDPASNSIYVTLSHLLGPVYRIAADGTKTAYFGFGYPDGVAIDTRTDTVYAGDRIGGVIKELVPNGLARKVGTAKFTDPTGLAIDEGTNDMYVTDANGLWKWPMRPSATSASRGFRPTK